MSINHTRLIIILVLLCQIAYPQQPAGVLKEGLITINLKDASFSNVLKILSEKTGLKFVADPEIQERKISLNLNDVSAEEAITAIMNSNALGYRPIEGTDIYMVADIRKIQRQTILKSMQCQYAKARELQDVLTRIVTPGVGVVIADERTNTLVLRENPEVLTRLEELVKQLDKPTPQIYIQAAIVEISLAKDNETGLEWLWKKPRWLSRGDRVATRFDLRATNPNPSYYDNDNQPLGIGLPLGRGLGIGIISKSFDAVMRTLQTDKEVNILSRPYLITLDNKEAVIEVGDQIPYKVLNQYGITSYEFKAATIKLSVKPHINNDQTITVEITPNADFQNGQTPDGIPIIARRMANTTVKIENDATIVIGGLMRESNTKTISKVPLLGTIPLIGALFRSKVDQKVKTELVVFINPRIITDELARQQFQPENILSPEAQQKVHKMEEKSNSSTKERKK